MFQVHRGYFSVEEQNLVIEELKALTYRPVPHWLGNFQFTIFGGTTGRKAPAAVRAAAIKVMKLHPEQKFNTLFCQRYEVGQSVKEHRDPKNNIGHTLVCVFGEFEGAASYIKPATGTKVLFLGAGDVLSLACTIDGKQGPPHSVSPVTSGTRYAVILNTIE